MEYIMEILPQLTLLTIDTIFAIPLYENKRFKIKTDKIWKQFCSLEEKLAAYVVIELTVSLFRWLTAFSFLFLCTNG